METNQNNKENPKQESLLFNLLLNIIIPVVILSKFAKEEYLGEKEGLCIAIAFPVAYFIYDWIKRKKINAISILGFAGILIMGAIGLLELPREYVAIERASVPVVIAIAVIISDKMEAPLVKKLLMNDQILNTEKIENALKENGKEKELNNIMSKSSYVLALTFLLSGVANYFLTQHFMSDESVAYNEALASVIKWSFPIIAIPSTIVLMVALWIILKKMEKLTGIEMDNLFSDEMQEKTKETK